MAAPLLALADEARGCTRCTLAAGRTQVVFGSGDPAARLMFVGEGPGAEEDRQGLPFVGRSGQLLDRLLDEELGLERSAVYVANVVKCRPPGNRDPRPDEIAACRPWLDEQLAAVAPAVVVTLGKFAAQLLLSSTQSMTALRGRAYPFGRASLVPTVHPAYALRAGAPALTMLRADLVRAKLLLAAAAPASPAPAAPGAP